jgi:3-oxocholest-4-en-26-oyl-CoA dehydrogenase beta subunit
VDVALSETQVLLRDSIRNYLRKEFPFQRVRGLERSGGYDEDLWRHLRSSGFLALPFPQDIGGSGGELTDMAVLLEELTRRAVAVPYMETMACALAAERTGTNAGVDLARAVMDGSETLAPAILERGDRFDEVSSAVQDGNLTGEKYFVDYGALTTRHLVAARESGRLGLYIVPSQTAEVACTNLRNLGRTPQSIVRYQHVLAERLGDASDVIYLLTLLRALTAIQCLGNAQQALDMTVDYVVMRVQFGRPIGTFQAVQHHIANMATMVAATRFLAYETVWRVQEGLASPKDALYAKAQASRTAVEVPMMAHQLHGGIGVTEEYDLHFFSRRGKERSVAWGSSEDCLAEIAALVEESERWL